MSTLSTILAKQPFFRGLSSCHLQALADSAMRTWFEVGELIFREGDVANRFYLIVDGKVALEGFNRNGRAFILQTFGPGELLGWSWMTSLYIGKVQARALEPLEAVFFYASRLRQQFDEDHDLGYAIFKRVAAVMMQRLHAAREQSLDCHTRRRKKSAAPRSVRHERRLAENENARLDVRTDAAGRLHNG